jgi:hypothetical protein
MRWVAGGMVLFSLSINAGHAFQYRLNYGFAELFTPIDSIFEIESLSTKPILTHYLYPSTAVQNSAFQIYSICYFFIDFLGFFVLNTCVEASLVLKLRKEIAEKRAKAEDEIRAMSANNSSGSAVVNKVIKAKQKRIEQDAKKETRVIVMVVTNSVVILVFRLPEILVFLSSNSEFLYSLIASGFSVFDNSGLELNYKGAQILNGLSNAMVSMSYLMYILTFTTNVAIYYLFNNKFKQHFIWWQSNVKQK